MSPQHHKPVNGVLSDEALSKTGSCAVAPQCSQTRHARRCCPRSGTSLRGYQEHTPHDWARGLNRVTSCALIVPPCVDGYPPACIIPDNATVKTGLWETYHYAKHRTELA